MISILPSLVGWSYCSNSSSLTETTRSSTTQPYLRYSIDDRQLVTAKHFTLLVKFRFGVGIELFEDLFISAGPNTQDQGPREA
jgi:hypothetical protein